MNSVINTAKKSCISTIAGVNIEVTNTTYSDSTLRQKQFEEVI